MKNLIVPIAGKSSRFPNTRPKWMLTHPKSNLFMVLESIKGINLDFFDKIYFVALKDHQIKFEFEHGFNEELKDLGLLDKSKLVYLDNSTKSQSETVYRAIKKEQIEGFIMVKDSDNYFKCNISDTNNQVCYYDLNHTGNINPSNKSYLKIDENNIISNIVEKQVISSTFSIGGYCFNSTKDFIDSFEKMEDIEDECYISNIIFDLILKNKVFYGNSCSEYKDWGTLEDWNKYKSQYNTLFVDLDGTLVENTSSKFPPYIGNGKPLKNNIKWLQELHAKGQIEIIITTSRSKKYKDVTLKELKEKGIPYNELIMGLSHSKRIIINDFASSNPYPSCGAINISRNIDNLNDFTI
jgi:hydroxymethylpyrimidine pyrophosphatase-like HAD family hydrolase|tara:strand:- start:68 stop:1126 length:1059 start_codon:yes stop_codon:yes gene_type:complete